MIKITELNKTIEAITKSIVKATKASKGKVNYSVAVEYTYFNEPNHLTTYNNVLPAKFYTQTQTLAVAGRLVSIKLTYLVTK